MQARTTIDVNDLVIDPIIDERSPFERHSQSEDVASNFNVNVKTKTIIERVALFDRKL